MTDTVAFTRCPSTGAIVPKSSGHSYGVVRLSGSYSGAPAGIEVRVLQFGTSTEIVSWGSAAILGGAWDIQIQVPCGAYWLQAEARFTNNHAVDSLSGNSWTVGYVFLLAGQSNMENMLSQSGAPPAADPYTTLFIPDQATVSAAGQTGRTAGVWFAPPVGDGMISFLNRVRGITGIPCGAVLIAPGGTALMPESAGPQGQFWLNATGSQANYPTEDVLGYALASMRAATGQWIGIQAYEGAANTLCDFDGILWEGNEGDIPTTTSARLQAGMTTLYGMIAAATLRTPAQLPFFIATIGKFGGGGPGVDYIRSAQMDWTAATPGAVLGPATYDIPVVDSAHVHHNPAGSRRVALRFADAVLHWLGFETYSAAGPFIDSSAWDGNATVTVTINLDGHAGLVADNSSTSLTGFEASIDEFVTLLAISSAHLVSGQVSIVLAGVPTSTPNIRYVVTAWNAADNLVRTSDAVPNDTLGYPLRPSIY